MHYCRLWDETRGDEYDSWGRATYFFELGSDQRVVRQLEIYENGNVLSYDQSHPEDQFGGLAMDFDPVDMQPFEISPQALEEAWSRNVPTNRRQ
jgi:hypothetical protein